MAEVKVAVVGAGIAGLTAALRLAERGYRVTLYESRAYLGGKLGAHSHDGSTYHEHCYHMFMNWYHNFWQLAEDIGVPREANFEPREAVQHLMAGEFPRFRALVNPAVPRNIVRNLVSGVEAPADMFLYAYSLIDLLSKPMEGAGLLNEWSVNAFMQSRPYATEGSADLHEDTLAKAFASPSYLTSASSYQTFIKYGYRLPEPMMWVMRGDVERRFNARLREHLTDLGCDIRLCHDVNRLAYDHDTKTVSAVGYLPGNTEFDCHIARDGTQTEAIILSPGCPRPAEAGEDVVDYVILAVPPVRLGPLLSAPNFEPGVEVTGARIPKLHQEPMASLDVYFNCKIPGLPKEHVVLRGSSLGLTFVDNSQLWPGETNTCLNVIATEFDPLVFHDPVKAFDQILKQLAEYIPFKPEDIDLDRTHFQPNTGAELFVNDVGSEHWRPGARTKVTNLFLAGDFVKTFVDVVTVEGAVVSGLQAAHELQTQAIADGRVSAEEDLQDLARPIPIVKPAAYPDAAMMAMKVALAPYAAAAKLWSWTDEQARRPGGAGSAAGLSDAMYMPWAIAAEVWRAGWSFYRGLLR